MDFRFNVNNLLPKRINKITHTLIPEGFKGDRREYNEYQRLLTRILDDMGEASAKAQGLNRTITSALKLRDTDHIIYLMVDSEGNNGLGSVIGLLKTGSKTLFMFDENGLHYQIKPRCILDFYIHESRQRMGLGNELYQHMLEEENLKPIKLAIDRPSDKFLAFLMKHYGLTSIIPQNNRFVVFKGFFDDEIHETQSSNRYTSSPSPSRQSVDHKIQTNNNTDLNSSKMNSINGTPVTRSAYGRYAASRPPCSMANIIHNTSVTEQPAEQTRATGLMTKTEIAERPDSLRLFAQEEMQENISGTITSNNGDSNADQQIATTEQMTSHNSENETVTSQLIESSDVTDTTSLNNATSALTISIPENDDKELNEEVKSENMSNPSPTPPQDGAGENQQSAGGHLDLKFYHSPLW